MTDLIKSITKYTFGKKLFVTMIFIIVVFSTVLTTYTFRLGKAFTYDGVKVDNGYKSVFIGDHANVLDKAVFKKAFEKYGFNDFGVYYDHYNFTLTAGEYKDSEFSVRLISSPDDIAVYPDISQYITAEDVRLGNKLIIVGHFTVRKSGGAVDLGKTVMLNGVEYTVVKTDGISDKDGNYFSDVAVDCEELRQTSDAIRYVIYTTEEISNSALKKFASANGITADLPEKSKYIVAFFCLSVAVCALFVANLAVLFNAFVRANRKFYSIFKILGITTAKLVVAMALPCVVIALFGALVGVGLDYAFASFTTVLEKEIYLSFGGAVAIVLLNAAGAFIGAMIASVGQAKQMPADSLRRAD